MIVGSPRRQRALFEEQLTRTDTALSRFHQIIGHIREISQDKSVLDAIDNAESSLALLPRSRSDVQIGSYDVYSTIGVLSDDRDRSDGDLSGSGAAIGAVRRRAAG